MILAPDHHWPHLRGCSLSPIAALAIVGVLTGGTVVSTYAALDPGVPDVSSSIAGGKPCCAKTLTPSNPSATASGIQVSSLGVLFDTSDFPPRWRCGTWTPLHGWVHIIADVLIWGAYASIPIILVYYVLRRRDVPFPRIFWLFAAFILACGVTHLMEAVIFWWPAYRVSAMLKVATAAVSWLTVASLIPIVPRALAIPSVLRMNEILQREIAERERVVSALREREARYAGIVNTAVDAIITINDHGVIDTMNPAAEKLFGWKVDEIRGKNVSMLMPSPYAEQHDDYIRAYCTTGIARIIGIGREVEGLRRDGSTFPAELAVSEVRIGTRRVFTGIVRDITVRKQFEQERVMFVEQLRQNNDELARKNQELDEFTYVASHDLQEPLRKLTSFSTLLRKDVGDDLPERASRDMEFIVTSAKRMQNLIQDLLSLSRAGRSELVRNPVSLEDCARTAISNLDIRIKETGATIELDPLPVVHADRTQMNQLYQNLIGNALKFLAPDRKPRIHLTAEETSDGITLGVQDNGIGIEAEYCQQIFAPFKRLHGRDKYEGSGIGLAICRKVVERHGGRIWVESEPGQGAHFKFTIGHEPTGASAWTFEQQSQPLSC